MAVVLVHTLVRSSEITRLTGWVTRPNCTGWSLQLHEPDGFQLIPDRVSGRDAVLIPPT